MLPPILSAFAAPLPLPVVQSIAQASLAQILQGGTWSCGRRRALKRDPQGSPPLRIQNDGTVF